MVHKQKGKLRNKQICYKEKQYINSKMKILYSNVDGILSKLLEIKDVLLDKKPHVFCITETKLCKIVVNDTLNIENYNIWRKDREGKEGGGVMILTSKEIQAKQICLDIDKEVEMVVIEVKTKEGDIIISNIYVPPQTRTWGRDEYNKLTENAAKGIKVLLEYAEEKAKRLMISGDFNSNIMWDSMEANGTQSYWDTMLLDVAQEFFLYQHITETTRKRGTDEPSLLDLVFTRHKEDIEEITYNPPIGKSDHVLLEFDFIVAYDILN